MNILYPFIQGHRAFIGSITLLWRNKLLFLYLARVIILMIASHIYTSQLFCKPNLLIAFLFALAAAYAETIFYHNALANSASKLPAQMLNPPFFAVLVCYGAATGILFPILIKTTCCWNIAHALIYGAQLIYAILNTLFLIILIAENKSLTCSAKRLFYLIRNNIGSVITYISELIILLGAVYLITAIAIGLGLIVYWRSFGTPDATLILDTTMDTIASIKNSALAESVGYFIFNVLFMAGLFMLYRSWVQKEYREVVDQIPPYMV